MDFATDEARELFFYATTDSAAYRRHLLPAYLLLEKKWKRGTFDRLKAMKLYTHSTLPLVARRYVEEHCGPEEIWYRLFRPDVRQEVASYLVDHHVNEMEIGNFHLTER